MAHVASAVSAPAVSLSAVSAPAVSLSVASVASVAILGCCWCLLLRIGVRSWRRTADLRHGWPAHRGFLGPEANGGGGTSRWTLVPAVAGSALLVIAAGQAPVARWSPALLLVAGAFVAASGLRARVVAVEAAPAGLTIRYAGRPPFDLPWTAFRGLRPPRVPWGGWRLERDGGAGRTLMPSDLIGLEAVLDLLVIRAGLRFDGRAWRR